MTPFRILLLAALAQPAAAVAAVREARVERTSPTQLTLRWSDDAPVAVYVATDPDATPATATPLAAAGHGTVTYADPGPARRYFLLRDTRDGSVVRVAERSVPLAEGTNFRDLGGYSAADGKQVRWGLIYRSAATPLLTADDVAHVRALGLTRMIDLRSSEERQMAPTRLTGIRYEAIDYPLAGMMPKGAAAMRNGGPLYRNLVVFLAPHLRMVFEELLAGRGPVMYHCTAGQDRTGIVTAMVLSALGVPRATILDDYALTTRLLEPGKTMAPITPAMAELNPVARMFAALQHDGGMARAQPLRDPDGRLFLDSAFDEVDHRYGSVENFLAREAGVGPAELARLRALYTE